MRNRIVLLAVIIMISIAAITLNPRFSTAGGLASFRRAAGYATEAAMLDELEAGLPKPINNADAVAAIKEKWDARQDLAGNTPLQIIRILYRDVSSVTNDKETLAALWKAWWARFGAAPVTVQPAKRVPETTSPPSTGSSSGTVANTAPGTPCPQPFVHDRYPMRAWLAAAASADGSKLIAASGSYKGLNFEVKGFSKDDQIGIEQWVQGESSRDG